jgi:hypothetical protein
MAKKTKVQSAAIVTIKSADEMTPKGRKEIAAWLRMHANYLTKYGDKYSGRFIGRYLYAD